MSKLEEEALFLYISTPLNYREQQSLVIQEINFPAISQDIPVMIVYAPFGDPGIQLHTPPPSLKLHLPNSFIQFCCHGNQVGYLQLHQVSYSDSLYRYPCTPTEII